MRSRMVILVAICILFAAPQLRAETTKSCPSGQLDILDWFTLDADLRTSYHMEGGHALYTAVWPDKFYWIKTPNGDTWDIQRYDNNFVYHWITGNAWGDPRSFKAHTVDVPLAPRCATPGYPGSTNAIPNTSFASYNNCAFTNNGNVAKAVTEVWGPYTAGNPGAEPRSPIGGDIPNNTTVYTVSWRWGCNNQYGNCAVKEEYVLAQRYGLVQWNAFNWVNGQYVLDASVSFNTLVPGNVAPYFPCF